MDSTELAARIDHTLLTPEATADDVRRLVAEGAELGVASVCVTASMVTVAVEASGGVVPVAAVVGFPSGAHPATVKSAEARQVVEQGAAEIDVVADLGLIATGAWQPLVEHLEQVRRAAGDAVLKVILESGLWSDEVLTRAVQASVAAGADFVKTSTGFHPCGGATPSAVRTMAEAAAGRAAVKASGGIRDRSTAETMLTAGASRLGCSSTRAVLAG